jgi:hypothetical protein
MPKYEPIDVGLSFKTSLSDLVEFHWDTNGIQASFAVPGEEGRMLSVSFNRQCIVRILDEMALSTESDDTPDEGLIPEHFAYRVHQAAFSRMQSEAWKWGTESLAHYRFITGWACLDVLSAAYPTFELRDR